MQTLIEALYETLIVESLDTKFKVHHDDFIKSMVNAQCGDRVYPAHTDAMYSDEMENHGTAVVRLKNKNKEVEYHLHSVDTLPGQSKDKEHQSTTAMLHAIKIIHDDAKKQVELGHKIRFQSATPRQHKIYHSIAKKLVKDKPERKVTDAGIQDRIDGFGKAQTIMVEYTHEGKSDFRKLFD